MADAILKEAADIQNESDSWAAMTWGIPFEAWGPFRDKTQAKKLTKLFDGQVTFFELNGSATLADREKKVFGTRLNPNCTKCDHPEVIHVDKLMSDDKQPKHGCLAAGCECKLGFGHYTKGGYRR